MTISGTDEKRCKNHNNSVGVIIWLRVVSATPNISSKHMWLVDTYRKDIPLVTKKASYSFEPDDDQSKRSSTFNLSQHMNAGATTAIKTMSSRFISATV